MRRIVIFILVALLGLALLGCTPSDTAKDNALQQENRPCQISTKEEKSSNNQMELDLKIPVISGLANQTLQEQLNQQINDQIQRFKAELEQSYAEISENAETTGHPVHPHQLYVNYETHTSGQILSLVVETYWYSGGAHGSTVKDFYNLDTKNGRLLTLSDLFKADARYIDTINQEIKRQIAAQLENDQDACYFEGEMGFQSIEADHPFYIKDNQLIMHFGQYEIAPYSSGMPEFALPLDTLKEQLQPSFQQLLAAT